MFLTRQQIMDSTPQQFKEWIAFLCSLTEAERSVLALQIGYKPSKDLEGNEYPCSNYDDIPW